MGEEVVVNPAERIMGWHSYNGPGHWHMLGGYRGRLASSSAAGVPPAVRGLQRSGGALLAWSSVTTRITASNSCSGSKGSRARVLR